MVNKIQALVTLVTGNSLIAGALIRFFQIKCGDGLMGTHLISGPFKLNTNFIFKG